MQYMRQLALLITYKSEFCLESSKNAVYSYFIILARGQSYNSTQWVFTLEATNTHSLAIGTGTAKKPRDANVALRR